MTNNLLKYTALAVFTTGALTGCGGGSDEGYDAKFTNENPVAFDEAPLMASLDEETGSQEIDLLAGATAGGEALTGLINISEMTFEVSPNYRTPQSPSNTIANQTISPFVEKDGKLVVATDVFADRLSTCDLTDVWGAEDAEGNNIGDGIPDNPAQVTYTISYDVDNGYARAPGEALPRRTLVLEMNAVYDAVESVIAEPAKVLLGSETTLFASVFPQKACDQGLTYTTADPSIATIDENGAITTVAIGTTTATIASTEDPTKSITVALEVFSAFTLDITNQDTDSNGLPTGLKEVPACVSAGFNVTPTPATGDALSGDYVYQWQSNNADFAMAEAISYGEQGTGRFTTGDVSKVGLMFDASVNIAEGNTGSTELADVEGQSVTATVVANSMCDPGVSAHAAGFNTDFLLDAAGANWGGGTVAASDTALSGQSIQITAGADEMTSVTQQVWNKQRNWHSATYGLGGASVGAKYKYSVWVKLGAIPASEVTLQHTVLAWKYEGGPSGPGFEFRRPGAGVQSAVLKPTTEWQLVELIDSVSGTPVWTVSDKWNMVTDVFQFWDVTGLAEGDTILLDEYAVMPVQ
ncbi:Ig-like domain-containing protein [Thalassotalea sp. PLHSN55]|uniref:Ig-like domain-containing protein n=1 Tax=Thalassotalea sp. PLHSN55 TaxID=3435888 RepID=UPI003F87FFBE